MIACRTFAGTAAPCCRPGTGRSLLLLALLIVTVLAAVAGRPLAAGAQQGRYFVWDSVDVTVHLRQDSSLHVTERDRVRFVGGPFHEGFRDIPLARIDRIDQIRVSVVTTGGNLSPYRYVSPGSFSRAGPNTYTSERVGSTMHIAWKFPAASSTNRTFQLEYDVHGALRVYDDAPVPYQQLGWAGVDRELTKDAQVNRASLTFVLPRPVDPDEVVIAGPGGTQPRDHTKDGQTWTWTASDLGPDEDLGAILKFPPLVTASKPAWQDASDRQELLRQQRDPRLNLIFLGLALLIAVGGGLFVLAAWWTRGRDPEIGPVAERLTAPPDDLPPAVVGALADEAVDERDIVATMIDLGRRGILRIDDPRRGAFAFREDFSLTLTQVTPDISLFERALLETFFGRRNWAAGPVGLADAKARFNAAGSELRRLLYDELVQRGFFRDRPSRTRIFWKSAGIVLLGMAAIAGLVALHVLPDIPGTVWLPVAALAVIGVLVWSVARAMPGKTRAGAEEAAKWRAFRNYLQAIDQFEEIDKAPELFDRYLPYAIAFGLEGSWVDTFSRASTPVPQWYGSPRWATSLPSGSARSVPSGGGTGHTWGEPSLQGVSNQAGQTLQGASNSMFAMFDAASQTFSGAPAAGWSAGLTGGSGFSGGLGGLSGGGGGGFR